MVTHLISRKKGRFVRSGTSIILAIAIAVGSHHAVIPGCDMKFGILWFVSFSILHFHTRKYVGVVCLCLFVLGIIIGQHWMDAKSGLG
jgi:uncharacterized membrane protein